MVRNKIMKQIDEALKDVGYEGDEVGTITRDQVTMCLFKLGYIKAFLKEESQAVNKICTIIENVETKEVSIRDLKIILVAINRLHFDWMHLTIPNVSEDDKKFKEFGFFYKGRYYLQNKEEIKAISKTFNVFLENKRAYEKTLKKHEETQKDEFRPNINKRSAKIAVREGKTEDRLQKQNQERRKWLEAKQRQKELEETKDCTFKPIINIGKKSKLNSTMAPAGEKTVLSDGDATFLNRHSRKT